MARKGRTTPVLEPVAMASRFLEADRRRDKATDDLLEARVALSDLAARLVGDDDTPHMFPVVFGTDDPNMVVMVSDQSGFKQVEVKVVVR